MPYFTFRDSEGLFELFLDPSEFNAYTDTIESPRTGERCRAIPQPFKAKVKEGGFNPPKIRPVTQTTLGSLIDKNSANSTVVSERAEMDKVQRYKEQVQCIEKMEEKLGQSLPRPVLDAPTPFWRKGEVDTYITKMNKEQLEKYIDTGKRPIGMQKRKKEKDNE